MKHDEKEVRRILEGSLGFYKDAAHDDIRAAVEHVWEKLKLDVTAAPGFPPMREGAPLSRARQHPWRGFHFAAVGVGAVALFIILAVFVVRQPAGPGSVHAIVAASSSEIYDASGGGSAVVPAGGIIEVGTVVGATRDGAALTLSDGSRIKMRAKSKLSLERADDGILIHLLRGGLIVNAARQGSGHLYVQTKEVKVSVVGTVFLVNAEAEGSRVAVIEGKVRVQQGPTTKTLLSGEQVATNPRMESVSVVDDLSWSGDADLHAALLQQAVVPGAERRKAAEFELQTLAIQPFVLQTASPTFEVATLKPTDPGRAPMGGTCRATDSKYTGALGIAQPPLGQCIFRGMTLKMLIQEAYDLKGPNAPEMVSGGPRWIGTERYDLQAKAERPTTQATMRLMLQRLLADRFDLKFHRDAKELPGFALLVAKSGLKMKEAPADQEKPGISRIDRAHPWTGRGVPVSMLATFFSLSLNRPVSDETGLLGGYDFTLTWTPGEGEGGLDAIIARLPPEVQAQIPGRDPNGPTIFSAVQEQLGLRLEARKVLAEIYVIDAAKHPTEN